MKGFHFREQLNDNKKGNVSKKIKRESKKIKVLIPGKDFNLIKQGQNFGGVTAVAAQKAIQSENYCLNLTRRH